MESEVGLSNAGVKKLIKSALAPGLKKTANDLSGVVAELTELYIHTIMDKAIQICNEKGKKTIHYSHVFDALDAMRIVHDKDELSQKIEQFDQAKASKPRNQLKLKT